MGNSFPTWATVSSSSYSSSSSTTSISSNNNNNNNLTSTLESYQQHYHNSVIKPTEAQLRWAQFQSKKRALNTKEYVIKLMIYPNNYNDINGIISDDCRSVSTYNSSDNNISNTLSRRRKKNKKKKNKVSISKGRRALLRVSKRAYNTT